MRTSIEMGVSSFLWIELKADIDAELDRVGEDDSWLEAGVSGIDHAEKFIKDIEVDCVGDLPKEA